MGAEPHSPAGKPAEGTAPDPLDETLPCTRVQKSTDLFQTLLSIALANSLNDWRLTSLNIRILFIGWYGLVQKFATFEGLANVLEKLAYMLNCQYICSGVIWRGIMNVKKKTTVEKISESEKTALYSISLEKDGTTEFENFVYTACAYRNR